MKFKSSTRPILTIAVCFSSQVCCAIGLGTGLWGCGEVTNRPTRTLGFLLQDRIASNTGTSSIFDARHDGDHAFPSASGSFARRSTRSSLCLRGTNRSFMPSKTAGAPVFIALLPFMTKP